MILDEKLRWAGFWILDGLRGGQTRKYYDRIRYAWKEGSSVAETEERIRNLIRHAVKTTDFYKDYPEDTPLEKLPVVNKDTFRQHYDSFLSSTYKDAEDNRVMCTSGSTGTPLRMIQNKDKICHNTAGGIFLGAAAGYYIGMKEAFIRVWVNNVRKSKLRPFMVFPDHVRNLWTFISQHQRGSCQKINWCSHLYSGNNQCCRLHQQSAYSNLSQSS